MSATTHRGIDYGSMSGTNRDKETGIHYGVISANDLPYWDESAESDYGEPHCPKCGNEAKAIPSHTESDPSGEGKWVSIIVDMPEEWEEWETAKYDYVCEDCEYIFGSESAYPESPNSFSIKDEDCEAVQGGEDRDVFILKSDYFTYAQFCSPCAPGACYLTNWIDVSKGIGDDEDYVPGHIEYFDNRAYCPPPSWFDEEEGIPFPIYSVESGKLLASPKKED
jgi:hypothetical protein